MKYLLLTFLLISSGAFAADKTVTCANSTCGTNFTPSLLLEKPQYTAIEVGQNSDNIVVNVPSGQAPRSLRISTNNGVSNKNLLLNLSSSRSTSNAGNTMVIGDLFNNLQINLNGFNGGRGKDASELCADRVKAGNYGLDAQNYFNQRRQADPGLNPNRCDRIDLSYLQSYNFTCDDPSYVELAGTNPIMEVKRIKFKARCSGILVQDLCLKRKLIARCYWRDYGNSCGKDGCTFFWGGNIVATERLYDEELARYYKSAWGTQGFCQNSVGQYAWYLYWDYTEYFTSPGVDPATYEVLPGSIWEVYYTNAYGKCDSYWTTVRTLYSTKIAYDETGSDCDQNSVGVPEDPNHLIPWAYTGMAQEPEFGLETVQCPLGECPVNSTLSDLERSLETIQPENGTNGTQQGQGIALIYDAAVINSGSIIGQGGAAGLADLDAPESYKFCGKIRDAESDGINSEYARNPTVSFRRYRWRALRTGAGGNPGSSPAASSNAVEVYKKMDSSARYLLTKELL